MKKIRKSQKRNLEKRLKENLNREAKKARKERAEAMKPQNGASGPPVSVPQICFNMWEEFENQFCIVDEQGKVAVHEFSDKKKKKIKLCDEKYVSNAILECWVIEPRKGKLLAAGGVDTKIYVQSINPEVKRGEKSIFMKDKVDLAGHSGGISGICFLDTQYIVSSSDDSAIMLWDLERPDRYIVKYNNHQAQVTCIDTFNLDSNILVSGSSDTIVRLWDIRMKTPCIRTFQKHGSSVNAVKFMFDQGNTVAVGCQDSSVLIYDYRAMGPIANLTDENSYESISALTFSRSNRILFTATKTTTIKVFDVIKEKKIYQLDGDHKDNIRSLATSWDGSTIASSSKDGIVQFWG